MTVIHVPHPKCGVRVNPIRNLLRIKPPRQRSQFGVHGLLDRQNVADRIPQFPGDFPVGAVLAVLLWMRRFLRRSGESLGAGNGLALARDLTAGIHGTCRVKELVVIVESEFSSVHTLAPIAFASRNNSSR